MKDRKFETVVTLFMCFALAFISANMDGSKLVFVFAQASVILGYFFGYQHGMSKALAERGRKNPPLPIFLGFVLYNFTIKDPVLPLFSLSLAVGNILAIYKNAQMINMLGMIIFSFMIAYFSCILAIVAGVLVEKIKTSK